MKNRIMALCLGLLAVVLFGCGSGEPAQPQESALAFIPADSAAPQLAPDAAVEEVTVRVFDDRGAEAEAFYERVGEVTTRALADAGVPARVAIRVAHPNEYMSYLLGSGAEPADIFTAYGFDFQVAQSTGNLADLTDELANHPELQATVTNTAWRAATVAGQLYAVPTLRDQRFEGRVESGVMVRKTVLEQLNRPMPTTPEELLEASRAAQAAGLPHRILIDRFEPPRAVHRTYEEWPFFVSYDSLLLYDTEGNVSSYFDSAIFRRDMEFLSGAQAEGLLRVNPSRWDEGEIFAGLGSYIHDLSGEGEYEIIQFNPDDANFRMTPEVGAFACVSAEANVPLALSVLEAIYTRPAVYQAFIYGEEGVAWERDDAGFYRSLREGDWLNGGYTTMPLTAPMFSEEMMGADEIYRADPATLIDFPAPIFTPSSSLYEQLLNGHAAYGGADGLVSLRCGLAKAEIYLEPDLETMRDFGLDTYVAAAQEQYTAFLAE